MTAPSGVPSAALARLVDRLWLISPAEADYAAAEMRCYDAAVAMTLGPTVHVWPAARGVLGTLWPAVPPGTVPGGTVAAALAACCRITEVDDMRRGVWPARAVAAVAAAVTAAAAIGLSREQALAAVALAAGTAMMLADRGNQVNGTEVIK